jgi:hypothetical protein
MPFSERIKKLLAEIGFTALIGFGTFLVCLVVGVCAYRLQAGIGLYVSFIWLGGGMWAIWISWKGDSKISPKFALADLHMLVTFAAWALAGMTLLSYGLHNKGWANYTASGGVTITVLLLHYLWHAIDMIPGLKLCETFQIVDPVTQRGIVAGACLTAFRFFLVIPFIAIVSEWLKKQKTEA